MSSSPTNVYILPIVGLVIGAISAFIAILFTIEIVKTSSQKDFSEDNKDLSLSVQNKILAIVLVWFTPAIFIIASIIVLLLEFA